MTAVDVEMVDGPLDGQIRAVEGDPMDPPSDIVFHQIGQIGFLSPGEESLPVRRLIYVREASPRDTGPLWLYRYSPLAPSPGGGLGASSP